LSIPGNKRDTVYVNGFLFANPSRWQNSPQLQRFSI
jgi:hypothetical protein